MQLSSIILLFICSLASAALIPNAEEDLIIQAPEKRDIKTITRLHTVYETGGVSEPTTITGEETTHIDGTTVSTDSSPTTSGVEAAEKVAATTPSVPISSSSGSSSTVPSSSATVSTSQTSESTSASSGSYSGQGTYYTPDLGSCGKTNLESDLVVAISHLLYDSKSTGNPNTNPFCGEKITAHYQGKTVEVTVVDRCDGCSEYDLDFSPSAFSKLADQSLGRIDITWEWSS